MMKISKRLQYEWTMYSKIQRRGFLLLLLSINILIGARVYTASHPRPLSPEETKLLQSYTAYFEQQNRVIKASPPSSAIPIIQDSTKKEAPQQPQKKTYKKPKRNYFKNKLELNSADSNELVKVRGIGKYTARGIVKYRNLLGGYYSVEQLREVYGMREKNYQLIQQQVYLKEPIKLRQINLNTATFKQILRHPYISYALTKEIFLHRNNDEIIDNVSDIKSFYSITDSIFQKTKAYIKVKD